MSDDKGFEVVDKRNAAEETEEPETQPEEVTEKSCEDVEADEETAQAPTSEESAEAAPDAEEKEASRPPDINTMVTWFIGMLASTAWQTMGLQMDPTTGKVNKDLDQAKLAIDCVMALADKINGTLDDSGRKELRGIISDLQINFVNQSKEG